MKNTITNEEIHHILTPLIESDIPALDIDTFAKKHQEQGQTLILRDADDRPVSFLLFEEKEDGIYINMMWTKENLRHNGLMQRFIHELIDTTDQIIHAYLPINSNIAPLFQHLHFTLLEDNTNTHVYVFNR